MNTVTFVGQYAHAEGSSNTVSGAAAHAEGTSNTVSGTNGHAEGNNNTVTNTSAHAEGSSCTASGSASHAEGSGTSALGDYSHCQGFQSSAVGNISHVGGNFCYATNTYGFIGGGQHNTIFGFNSNNASVVCGAANVIIATGAGTSAPQATIVGGSTNTISNNVETNANVLFNNSIILGGSNHDIQIDPASSAGAISIQSQQNVIAGGNNHNIQNKSLGSGTPSTNNNAILGGLNNAMFTYGGNTSNNGILAGQNHIMTSTGSAFDNVILGGNSNQVYESSFSSVVGGFSDFINTSLHSSILGGTFHTITSSTGCCILGGDINQISNSTGCTVMGSNHILNNMHDCTVCGYYSNTTSSGATALLIVGNGNGSSRSNAFRVDRSGSCFAGSTFINGGADFAEYFEAAPGTSFRVGQSVYLDGNGLLVDVGVQPFGVVRPKDGTSR